MSQNKIHSGSNVHRSAVSLSKKGADNVVVKGIPKNKIKILSMHLQAENTVGLTIYSGKSKVSGEMSLGSVTLPVSSKAQHWIETQVGEDLKFGLSDSVQVSGFIVYAQEDPAKE